MENNYMTKIKELRKEIAALKKTLQEQCKIAFKLGTDQLFEQNPTLKSFGWRQYTPYYSDGDPCYFSTQTDIPCINENYEGDDDYDEKLGEIVAEFLGDFTDDDLLEMFGDHSEVIVTKNEITVENCEHD
jgi:hypothetical protein